MLHIKQAFSFPKEASVSSNRIRKMEDFEGLWIDQEGVFTNTSVEQSACEKSCASFLKPLAEYAPDVLKKLKDGGLSNQDNEIRLLKTMHAQYMIGGLQTLPGGFVSLDPSRTWIMYWVLHTLELLDREPTHLYPRVISTLKHMQNPDGGFGGGGRYYLSQCAPQYGAVLALCIIGTPEALNVVNRPAMYHFFMRMKQPCGAFSIHDGGEFDSRSTYTVLAIARVLNILTPEMKEGVADYILSCQTYEGGFGGEPGNEAHGGYNFCAVAGLIILQEAHRMDVDAQENWLLRRQTRLEGGFSGRTNKLVDSCYSFWQGAAMAMVEVIRVGGGDTYDMEIELERRAAVAETETAATAPPPPEKIDADGDIDYADVLIEDEGERVCRVTETSGAMSYNQEALQRYILHCCQNVDGGGMRDKPEKHRDFYHSCYSLSGLSISQRFSCSPEMPLNVFGDFDNLLEPTSIVFNIGVQKLKNALDHYMILPHTHEELTAMYSSAQTVSARK